MASTSALMLAASSGNLDVTDPAGKTFSNNGSGALYGGTMGYNWQFGRIVYSAELDLGIADASHTRFSRQ